MLNPYPCPQTGCNYPEGECSGACLVPAAPRARHHGLPIDLVEPDAPAPVGDRVPCHLSMPEVAWPVPVGPVIRVRPRREYWLTEAPYRPTPNPGPLEPVGFGLVSVLSLCTGFIGAALLVAAHLKGWL